MEEEKKEIMSLLRRRDMGLGRKQIFMLLPWLSETRINLALASLLEEGIIVATGHEGGFFELSATLKAIDGGLGSYFRHHLAI